MTPSPRSAPRTNEVNVVFTVTDKHGRRITDLKQGDFRIFDDNKPPQEIRSFHAETNLPLQVGLLIDASNSVRDRFKFEQESAIEFLNQTIHPRNDQAFVVGFDVTPEVTQDFTDNTEQLAHGVHELHPGGGTALYDAFYFACRDKLMKAPKSVTVRRAIILLSDGDDNQSHVTREEAIEMAQRAEAIIYTISTNVSGTKGAGRQSSRTHRRRHRRARLLPLPDSRCGQRLCRNPGRTPQPVRGCLQARRPQARRPLSHHRNPGQRPENIPGPRSRRGWYAPGK